MHNLTCTYVICDVCCVGFLNLDDELDSGWLIVNSLHVIFLIETCVVVSHTIWLFCSQCTWYYILEICSLIVNILYLKHSFGCFVYVCQSRLVFWAEDRSFSDFYIRNKVGVYTQKVGDEASQLNLTPPPPLYRFAHNLILI